MFFVTDHGEHEGHRVIDALNTAVRAGLVEACGGFVYAEALVEGAGEFGEKLEAIVGKEGNGASQERI